MKKLKNSLFFACVAALFSTLFARADIDSGQISVQPSEQLSNNQQTVLQDSAVPAANNLPAESGNNTVKQPMAAAPQTWSQESHLMFDLLKAQMQFLQSDTENAAKPLQQLADELGNAQLIDDALIALITEQDYQAASELLNKHKTLMENYAYAYILALLRDDVPSAVAAFEKKLSDKIDASIRTQLLSSETILSGLWYETGVLHFYQAIAEKYPDSFADTQKIDYMILLATHGQMAAAEKVFKSLQFKFPRNERLLQTFAMLLVINAEDERAIQYYLEAIKDYPSSLAFQAGYLKLLYLLGKYKQADKQLHTLSDKHKESIEIKQLKLMLDAQLGKFDSEASLDGMDLSVREQISKILVAKKEFKAAEKIWEEQISELEELKVDPSHYLEYYKILASIYYRQAMVDPQSTTVANKKADELMAYIANYMNEIDFQNTLVHVFIEAKRYQDARNKLESYLTALGPQKVKEGEYLLFSLLESMMDERLGQKKASLAKLAVLYQKYPHNQTIQNAYGYTLLLNNQQIEKAGKMIRKALQVAPRQDAVIDSMGYFYLKTGKPKQALTYFRGAMFATVEEFNIEPESAAHYLIALYDAGEIEKAKTYYFRMQRRFFPDEMAEFFEFLGDKYRVLFEKWSANE